MAGDGQASATTSLPVAGRVDVAAVAALVVVAAAAVVTAVAALVAAAAVASLAVASTAEDAPAPAPAASSPPPLQPASEEEEEEEAAAATAASAESAAASTPRSLQSPTPARRHRRLRWRVRMLPVRRPPQLRSGQPKSLPRHVPVVAAFASLGIHTYD